MGYALNFGSLDPIASCVQCIVVLFVLLVLFVLVIVYCSLGDGLQFLNNHLLNPLPNG